MRGSRVQAVVSELQGEKIDIIPVVARPATFVVNALAPAEVTKVVLDDEKPAESRWWCRTSSSRLAIGRRGQNVRLASILSGWDIDIMTEAEEESRRRSQEDQSAQRSQMFMDALDVDDVIAHLLVAEGFTSIEQVAFRADRRDGPSIEGFDEGHVAEELAGARAQRLPRRAEPSMLRAKDRYHELGVVDDAIADNRTADHRRPC